MRPNQGNTNVCDYENEYFIDTEKKIVQNVNQMS